MSTEPYAQRMAAFHDAADDTAVLVVVASPAAETFSRLPLAGPVWKPTDANEFVYVALAEFVLLCMLPKHARA
jgi:hypothetical protein